MLLLDTMLVWYIIHVAATAEAHVCFYKLNDMFIIEKCKHFTHGLWLFTSQEAFSNRYVNLMKNVTLFVSHNLLLIVVAGYPSKCDSQQNSVPIATQTHNPKASLPESEQEAVRLEQTHVHEVYQKIAEHFSDTRHKPWPKVAQFLNSLKPGSVVVDVG